MQNDASSSNFGNRFKSPSHEKAWQLDVKGKKKTTNIVGKQIDFNQPYRLILISSGVHPQKCEHVAKGLMSIIKDGKSGSVWLIANEKAPKEVPYSSI